MIYTIDQQTRSLLVYQLIFVVRWVDLWVIKTTMRCARSYTSNVKTRTYDNVKQKIELCNTCIT